MGTDSESQQQYFLHRYIADRGKRPKQQQSLFITAVIPHYVTEIPIGMGMLSALWF